MPTKNKAALITFMNTIGMHLRVATPFASKQLSQDIFIDYQLD